MRRPALYNAKLADDIAEAVRRSHAAAIRAAQADLDVLQNQAWGRVAGATGALSRSFGVRSVNRNGTGDYTITLTDAIDPDKRDIRVVVRSAGASNWYLVPDLDTPTQFRVGTYLTTSGASQNADFSFVVQAL